MKLSSVLLLVCFTVVGFAQSSYQFGVLPAINFNKKLENNWKVNFKIESRQSLKEGIFNEQNDFEYDYILSDFSLIVTRKIDYNKSISAGYLMRFRDQKIIYRSIQQLVIKKKYTAFVVAHRLATDQTYAEGEAVNFRFRYRISSEIPLNGQSLDANEYYLKINHEYLNAFQETDYDLEIRWVPMIGYAFTNQNKIELGLDYRLSAFINNPSENKFWCTMNWYISI